MALPNDTYTHGLGYGLYETEEDDGEGTRSTESSFSSEFNSSIDRPISSTPSRSLVRPPHDQNAYRRLRSHGTSGPHPYYPPHDRRTPIASWYEHTDIQIRNLMESQHKLMFMFETFSNRIGDIEKAISSLKSASSANTSPEEKLRVPPQLSKTVGMIHEALEEERQFRPQLGAKDQHNRDVKKCIEEEISLNKENSYSKVVIERAIQRYFESRRRSWRELTDPAQQERVLKQARNRRVRSRKQRLYERRLKAVSDEGQEEDRYSQLSLDYMSEESSSDESAITVHRPEWRSDVLTRFLQELDKRIITQRDTKRHVPERKERILGPASVSSPPLQAPKWTVCKDWLKGLQDLLYNYYNYDLH